MSGCRRQRPDWIHDRLQDDKYRGRLDMKPGYLILGLGLIIAAVLVATSSRRAPAAHNPMMAIATEPAYSPMGTTATEQPYSQVGIAYVQPLDTRPILSEFENTETRDIVWNEDLLPVKITIRRHIVQR
jgi:hypothetical protein